MTIRKASQYETDYILQLSGNVVGESSMGYAPNNAQAAYNIFFPLIRNGAYYLLDEDNRGLKGWILLGTDWNPLVGKSIGNLFHLYVFPQYRNEGIGKKLMQAAIQELQQRGIETIQLNVFAGNPAKALYKKLGFRSISTMMELNVRHHRFR